jgi:hypothetical protein
VDKDFAEITACSQVWPDATLAICWWHMKDALQKRSSSANLSVDHYKYESANAEFAFIDKKFVPAAQVTTEKERRQRAKAGTHDHDTYNPKRKSHSRQEQINKPTTSTQPLRSFRPNTQYITAILPVRSALQDQDSDTGDDEEVSAELAKDKRKGKGKRENAAPKHEFCPANLRKTFVEMVETHFCGHISIQGPSGMTKEGIREWAVRELWNFCMKNDLRELWAYMWVHWYRQERWKLWARSVSESIARIKTTMLCETQ